MKETAHDLPRMRKWRALLDNPRLRQWVSTGAFLFTIGFLLTLLAYGYGELRQFDNWQAYLVACMRGFLLYPVSLSVQALTWRMMMARLGSRDQGWRDIEIYAYTYLMRRLPGALWYLAGRTVRYYEEGIGAYVTLAASGLEWLLLLAMAAAIYGVLSPPFRGLWWMLAFLVVTILITDALRRLRLRWPPPEHTRLPRLFRQVLRGLSTIEPPRGRELVLWMGLYAVAYVTGGLILFLLVHSVAPMSGITVRDAIRIWALAGGVGFLTSALIPAGMGVRELTLTALLVPNLSVAGALLVAVLLRLLFIVSDLVWGGFIWIVARTLGQKRRGL